MQGIELDFIYFLKGALYILCWEQIIRGPTVKIRKNSQDAITVSQARDEDGLDNGSSSESDEKWSNFEYTALYI